MSELPPTPPPLYPPRLPSEVSGDEPVEGQASSAEPTDASLVESESGSKKRELDTKDTQEIPVTRPEGDGDEAAGVEPPQDAEIVASVAESDDDDTADGLKAVVLARVRETREELLRVIDGFVHRQAERLAAMREEHERKEQERAAARAREQEERELEQRQREEEEARVRAERERAEEQQTRERDDLRSRVAALEEELAQANQHAERVAALEGELVGARSEASRIAALEAELAQANQHAQRVAALETELAGARFETSRIAALEEELAHANKHVERVAVLEAEVASSAAQGQRLIELEREVASSNEELLRSASVLSAVRRSFLRLDAARSQAEILSRLLEEATRFASRSALLLVREEESGSTTLVSWSSCGLGGDPDQPWERPCPDEWSQALGGQTVQGRAALGALVAEAFGADLPVDTLLVPMVLRDRTSALLYVDRTEADHPFQPDAVQLLCFGAAQAVETLPLRELRPAGTLTDPVRRGRPAGFSVEPPPSVPSAPEPVIEAGAEQAEALVEAVAEPGVPEPEPEAATDVEPAESLLDEPEPAAVIEATEAELVGGEAAAGFELEDLESTELPSDESFEDLGVDATTQEVPLSDLQPEEAEASADVAGLEAEVEPEVAGLVEVEAEELEVVEVEEAAEDFEVEAVDASEVQADLDEVAEAVEVEAEAAPESARWTGLGREAVDSEQADTQELDEQEEAGAETPTQLFAAPSEAATALFPTAGAVTPPRPPSLPAEWQAREAPQTTAREAPPSAPAPPPAAPEPSAPAARVGGEVRPPADLVGPGWAFSGPRPGSSPEEHAHDEARRLARLLVSELQLYNEEEIEDGRRQGNIYRFLKEHIDKSRVLYEERIDERVRQGTDYFRDELVKSLAGGDARLLGMP